MVEGGGGRGEGPKVMGRDMMGNERGGEALEDFDDHNKEFVLYNGVH